MEEEGRVDREHGSLQSQHPDVEWRSRGKPKPFQVVAKATTREEEEGAKTYQKGHPVKGCQNGWRMSIARRHPDVPAESPLDGSHGCGILGPASFVA